jgi:hypothetical protein
MVVLVALPLSVMVPKALSEAGESRCQQRAHDAWGYSTEWDWSELGFICTFNGRDYRPNGERVRVGLTELF